jgi:hypothetical protein
MNIETDYIASMLELSKPVGTMTWDEAMAAEWPNGWRMPTLSELASLYSEAIKARHKFANTSGVWSASLYDPDPSGAWLVYFAVGAPYANNKTYGNAVRLVREMTK